MKILSYLYARLITWKYRLHWSEIKNTKWPKIKYITELKGHIVFCPNCGEYISNDGICSNPWCPEIMEG